MNGPTVLLTNVILDGRAKTELYIRDLAKALLRLGATPVVYSPRLGPVAHELRSATIAVVDDLETLTDPPDIIHGHHLLQTAAAMLRFDRTPAIYVCHDWSAWCDEPPGLSRVRRHVAVDYTCRDRLHLVYGIPKDEIEVIFNFVDLERFRPRPVLPDSPRRALVFGSGGDGAHVGPVKEACERMGLVLDLAGPVFGNLSSKPEELLAGYDLVFAKARCALEAMAVGCAVVVCDAKGLASSVSTDNLEELRKLNFGARTLQRPLDPELIVEEIKKFDPAGTQRVRDHIRSVAGVGDAAAKFLAVYKEAIDENVGAGPFTGSDTRNLARILTERQAQLDHLSMLYNNSHVLAEGATRQVQEISERAEKQVQEISARAENAQREAENAQREAEGARVLVDGLRGELAGITDTVTYRARKRVLDQPMVGRAARLLGKFLNKLGL